MSQNKKLTIILIISLVIITVLITQVIIPCIDMYKEQQRIKNATVIVELKEDLELNFYSETKLSDLIVNINGELKEDITINTKEIGTNKVTFKYVNDENIEIPYTFKYTVVDKTPPVVWLGSSYTVYVGADKEFYKDIMCGDDLDNKPVCKVEGYYDTNKAGSYDLNFIAYDYSGNQTTHPFTLYVKERVVNNSKPSTPQVINRTAFSDIITNYKTDKTKIGLDVSGYQGEIDYDAVKAAGVEFVFIKVGGTLGIDGEYYVDSKFKRNIEGFNRVGIPVGIYFFSYAPSKKSAIKDAEWVYEQIKDYKVELPIVYDWENWSFYNEFNLSFYNLTANAEAFLDTLNKKGYEGMLYGSKNYIDKIWLKTDYPIWVAHYTSDPTVSYEEYAYWQICDNGQIDGIYGNVDINIMYVKE
ncbi:MAG: GH25 family lysozyme [Candidatus Coprovivens sp.]